MNEHADFVLRCQLLERQIKILMAFENSPRVWTSVLTTLLATISVTQEDPTDALDQIITVMKNIVKEKSLLMGESVKGDE